MPRAGLSTDAVVDAATAVVDDVGLGGLSLAAVAARTGVAAPSLYKHVGGLGELRALVGIRAMTELTDRLEAAVLGRSGDDAVAALMHAARAYVTRYPARYEAMPADPLHDPIAERAGQRWLGVVLAVLRGYGLSDSAAVHAARKLRVVMHGFALLEAGGGFGLPEDLDDTYAQLVRMLVDDLRSLPRQGETS